MREEATGGGCGLAWPSSGSCFAVTMRTCTSESRKPMAGIWTSAKCLGSHPIHRRFSSETLPGSPESYLEFFF
jgi:hypothetical protein